MDTIQRTPEGYIHLVSTVAQTVKYILNTQRGFIYIDCIQRAINQQLPEYEQVQRKHIIRALVILLEKGNQRHD